MATLRRNERASEPVDAGHRWRCAAWFGLTAEGDAFPDLHRLMAEVAHLPLAQRVAEVENHLDTHGLRESFDRFAGAMA